MQFFKRKAKSAGRVGLVVNAEQLAIVHVVDKDGLPFIQQCETWGMDSPISDPEFITKHIKNMGLDGLQCSAVMNPDQYSIHLVEAPDVEPGELRAAVRWKLKDLLDMKIEEAAIDIFEVPEDAYRGRKMVYVVAARKSRIQEVVGNITDAGLELAIIDVPELAMKNVSNCYLDDSKGIAFMDLRRTGSTINITRENALYLTRRINTQLDAHVMESAEWGTLKDRLVLEIQRSLDYYESQMGQGRIDRVVIAHREKDTDGMLAALNEMLTAEVSVLDLTECIGSAIELTPKTQQICMTAIGGTLRGKTDLTRASEIKTDSSNTDSHDGDEPQPIELGGNPQVAVR